MINSIGYMAGIITTEEAMRLKKLVFRATMGNSITQI
jgi:hypothetical protein